MWESLLNDCQIVCSPHIFDLIVNAKFMVEELKVAVEVESVNVYSVVGFRLN